MECRSSSTTDSLQEHDQVSPEELEAIARRKVLRDRLQDKNTGSRLRKNLLLSAGLATAGIFTGGHVLPRIADYEREQQRMQEVHKNILEIQRQRLRAAEERHAYFERIHTLRRHLISEARQGLENITFDFARFQLRASQLDALEDEDRDINIPAAEAKFEQVMTRFREALVKLGNGTDPRTIVIALYLATTDYEYHHIDGLTFPDSITETSGDCKFAAQLYPAILWRQGIHEGVGMRLYAPPAGRRIGHRAPAWQVPHPDGGVVEYDLISGGSPYRNDAGVIQGAFLSMPDYLTAYERWHEAHPVPSIDQLLTSRSVMGSRPRITVGSDLAGDHLETPPLTPTESHSFPMGSPPAGGPLMGIYRSENGRITWQAGQAQSQRLSIESSVHLTRENEPSFAHGRHFNPVSIYTPPDVRSIESYGSGQEEVDRLLLETHQPTKRAVLLATSLNNWSFFQETWTAQHRPRNAESARHLMLRYQRELHEALRQVTADELIRDLHFNGDRNVVRSGQAVEREGALQFNTGNILLDHELGWPLLFQLVSQSRLGEAHFQGDTYRHLVIILSQLIRTSNAQEEEQLRPLLARLSLHTRRFLYLQVGDYSLHDPLFRQEQDFSRFIVYSNAKQALELSTGIIHAPYQRGMPFGALDRPIIGHTPIVWSSFADIRAAIETQVQRRQIDPQWETIGIFAVLEQIIWQLPYASNDPLTPEQRAAATSLQGSEVWVQAYQREIRQLSPTDDPARFLQNLARLTRKLRR